MKGYLLDTNVLSEIVRRKPDPQVLERLRMIAEEQLFSSEVCAMELRFGASRSAKRKLWNRIESEVLGRVTLLAFDHDAAICAGDIVADLMSQGSPIGVEDVMIGATAKSRGLIVATRNVRHYSRISGLRVENPWVS